LGAGDISRAGLSRRLVTPGGTANGSVIGAGASQTPTQLHVQFGNAARVLREQLLRNVVEAQFGGSGTRIMSLLRDMGKLEEKHISKLTLMPMGETRDVCSRLFAASLLSLQEVPKSSDRSAARTIFFWYVNEKKCTAWLCDHLFKTLSRLSQRRRHELVKEADLISKSQRIDIAQDHSLMNDIERRRLQKVQDTVGLIALGEQRTWQDLFVVLQLPE
jgi:DNA-directed RNA polymerase III subunit RPC3